MSTWISKARITAVSLFLFAAACVPAGGPTLSSQSAPLFGGTMTAAVPSGYCIDTKASHDGQDEAVMIAGRCSTTSTALPAVITISIGRPDSSAVLKTGGRALSDWATSREGRAALARDGRASSVRILQTVVADGAFLIYLSDRATGDHWRAILGLRGRLVTVSITAPDKSVLDQKDGRALMGRVLARLRAAN